MLAVMSDSQCDVFAATVETNFWLQMKHIPSILAPEVEWKPEPSIKQPETT